MHSSLLAAFATIVALAGALEEVHYDPDAYNDAQFGAIPTNDYHSNSASSPQIQVNIWDHDAVSKSGSHILLQHDSPSGSKRAGALSLSASPLLLRADDLSAVYMNRSFPGVANVNVQKFDGKPILSFYGGPLEGSSSVGNGYIFGYDEQYHAVGRLTAENLKVGADAHEFIMTGPSTAIVTAYETIEWDLRVYGGDEHGSVLDSIFQEIDLDTFEVLFQWRASEHFPMDQSYKPLDEGDDDGKGGKYGWDFFHITSVEKSAAGHYLVSAAHMHAIYLIDGAIGRVIWTLGGKRNDFRELDPPEGRAVSAPALTMAWQHHARFYPGRGEGEITVFDNHGISINGWGCTENCSRGLHLKIDAERREVQLLTEFLHPQGLWSISQGSVQVLEGGNVFVGWGRNPAVTEHTADGRCVFDMQFSPWRSPATDWQGLDSYRAFKVDWAGRPYWAPDIAAEKSDSDDLTVWASWNGATDVREWVLLGSQKERDLNGAGKVIARAARDGFETVLWVEKSGARYLRVVAIGAKGEILHASDTWDVRYGVVKPAGYPVTEVEEKPAKGGQKEGQKGGQKGEGGSGTKGGDNKKPSYGMPVMTYHDYFSNEWSFGGMVLRIGGFGLGVWLFSRLF